MVAKEKTTEYVFPYEKLVTAPAGELLSHGATELPFLPPEIAEEPLFLDQLEGHRMHIDALDAVTERIPNPTTTIEEALNHNLITPEQAELFYFSLTEILSDADYESLALYLPFEFLPRSSWHAGTVGLERRLDAFRTAYLTAWQNQLNVRAVRANFVDGDVLEESQRLSDLPRVVKAAHMMPHLVDLGLIQLDTVENFYDEVNEPILKRSIAEALSVVYDDPSFLNETNHEAPMPTHEAPTERRQAWLDQVAQEKKVMKEGKKLAKLILGPGVKVPEFKPNTAPINKYVFIQGIQTAIEQAWVNNPTDPQSAQVFDTYKDFLIVELETTDDAHIRERITTLFRRAEKLNLINQADLKNLGIVLPHLSGDLSRNLEQMPAELTRFQKAIDLIENDPELSQRIYPFLSINGSRLKGYGAETSDLDTGIFVRPETAPSDKYKIRELIEKHFKAAGIDDEPIEFWFDTAAYEKSGQRELKVSQIEEESDAVIADKYWSHILFNSAFVGNQLALEQARQKLLPAYFETASHPTHAQTDRALYLERLEQDLLQYRLMHKGYARHYPRYTWNDSVRYTPIDGDSAFWDSGYRRLATQLYVEKVFLPKI